MPSRTRDVKKNPPETGNSGEVSNSDHLCALTLSAVRSVESRLALALAEDALSVAGASLGAVPGELGGDPGHEGYVLRLAVVVVEGEEPVAGVQEVGDRAAHRGLKRRTRSVSRFDGGWKSPKGRTVDIFFHTSHAALSGSER